MIELTDLHKTYRLGEVNVHALRGVSIGPKTLRGLKVSRSESPRSQSKRCRNGSSTFP